MKKRLVFEVEEGDTTSCEECTLSVYDGDECVYRCCDLADCKLSCKKYNLSTLKFIGEEKIEKNGNYR